MWVLMSKNKRAFFWIFLILLGAVLFYVINIQSFLPNPIKNIVQNLDPVNQAIDEPFKELTIPYLREKTYDSKLGALEQISQNSNYSSYLTSYKSDGLRINGLLTKPSGEEPKEGWPAIVFIHGYIPPTQYRTLEKYVDHIDFLARSGFVVFKVDLRGNGESEGEAGGAYYSSDYIIDVLNAVDALKNSNFVKKNSIGLWGHSMAGNIILRSIAVNTNISAAVIWAGAVYSYEDFQKYGLNDNSYRPPSMSTSRNVRRQKLFAEHGEFSKESDFWKKVVATNYLKDIKTSIQLHHCVDDNVVNINYSRNLNNILNKTTILHELYEYGDGGHNITGTSFNSAMERTIDFFKKNL